MAAELNEVKVAILATDGFEQVELEEPRKALEQAGAKTQVVAPKDDSIRGWDHTDWGEEVKVDVPLKQAKAEDFDALFVPGGVMNPDTLRQNKDAVSFVKEFFSVNKPVASICHGPQVLIEADVVQGKKLTSYPSVKKDLENAGAEWVDQETVVDGNLLTSRSPKDLEAFNQEMKRCFRHSGT